MAIPQLNFRPDGDKLGTKLAAIGYESIWRQDGQAIIEAFQGITGLAFWYRSITVQVVPNPVSEAGRRYHRMKLSAFKFTDDERRRVLSHEIAHRLLVGNGIEAYGRTSRFYDHYYIDLFLYDAWEKLWGKQVADAYVQAEKSTLEDTYTRAWHKALALTPIQRQAALKRLIDRNH